MYHILKQEIKCSKCGSNNYENFSDDRYSGKRCKTCGHENKELHPHLRQAETASTGYQLQMPRVLTF